MWEVHNDWLVECGLRKQDIEKVVDSGIIKFRDGVEDFLDFLNENKIPLIIFSSSGIGNAITLYLEKRNKNYSNISVVSNIWKFDENGKAVKIIGDVIHGMNKDETSLPSGILEKVKNRKNVLLLGDSVGDVGMIEGFNYDNLIKVGFLNENAEENLEEYKKNFDVVLTGDCDFSYVGKLVRELIN